MQVQQIGNMFRYEYQKTAVELVTAMTTKVTSIKAKVEERIARIAKVRTEYRITDAALLDVMKQARQAQKAGAMIMNYSTSSTGSTGMTDGSGGEQITVGAGIVNFLLTEQDFIEGEQAQVERLELVMRNLKDPVAYTRDGQPYTQLVSISHDEAKFLGF
jgi:hypothetical protein